MASLHYIFAPMNASKSAQSLMVAYNYEERDMRVWTVKPKLDTRDGEYIQSRALGIKRKVDCIVSRDDSIMREFVVYGDILRSDKPLGAIIVDEAQFLTKEQINELRQIVDVFEVPVMAYGLRTDAFTNMFEGSKRLFEVADKFQEFKTICPCCGGKAIFNMRLVDGKPSFGGEQVQAGDNYLPVCSKRYYELKEMNS